MKIKVEAEEYDNGIQECLRQDCRCGNPLTSDIQKERSDRCTVYSSLKIISVILRKILCASVDCSFLFSFSLSFY